MNINKNCLESSQKNCIHMLLLAHTIHEVNLIKKKIMQQKWNWKFLLVFSRVAWRLRNSVLRLRRSAVSIRNKAATGLPLKVVKDPSRIKICEM